MAACLITARTVQSHTGPLYPCTPSLLLLTGEHSTPFSVEHLQTVHIEIPMRLSQPVHFQPQLPKHRQTICSLSVWKIYVLRGISYPHWVSKSRRGWTRIPDELALSL